VPDWVIIPGGNLGNVSALGSGFDLMYELGLIRRKPRICVAQAQSANPLYLAYKRGYENFEAITAKPTEASAIRIGNPVSIRRAIRTLQRYEGVVEQASESELAEAAAAADRTGTFCCPHTGVALAALVKLVERGEIKKRDRVVVISTASGLKFTDFKIRYHEGTIEGVKSREPNQPIPLPNDYDAVKRTVLEAL
jgi:threonine synthase